MHKISLRLLLILAPYLGVSCTSKSDSPQTGPSTSPVTPQAAKPPTGNGNATVNGQGIGSCSPSNGQNPPMPMSMSPGATMGGMGTMNMGSGGSGTAAGSMVMSLTQTATGTGCTEGGSGASLAPATTTIAPVTFPALYVVNGGDSSISVLNTSTRQLAGTIRIQNLVFPHHISFSQDGASLVVAVPGMDMSGGHDGSMPGAKGAILVLDAATGKLKASKILDAMNHNGAISGNGLEIWTSSMMEAGAVTVLNASTLAMVTQIPVGSMPAEVTFSQNGMYAFVANGGSASVSVIDAMTKKVLKTLPVGADPVGAWRGNDGVMYVDSEKGQSITAISADTLQIIATYQLGFTPGMAATAPGGELWVSDADHGKVVYFMAGSTMKMGEIAVGANAHAITFSADGRTGYVTNQGAASVSVIDVKSHAVVATVAVGTKPNGEVFRPVP